LSFKEQEAIMRKVVSVFAAALLILPAAALAQGQAGQVLKPGTAGPQPHRGQPAGNGLFPPNEPVPPYATGANNPNASLASGGGSASPNAGNTGLRGSSGNSYGWQAPAYSNR
jgi:hypothetical protein